MNNLRIVRKMKIVIFKIMFVISIEKIFAVYMGFLTRVFVVVFLIYRVFLIGSFIRGFVKHHYIHVVNFYVSSVISIFNLFLFIDKALTVITVHFYLYFLSSFKILVVFLIYSQFTRVVIFTISEEQYVLETITKNIK